MPKKMFVKLVLSLFVLITSAIKIFDNSFIHLRFWI